jgi:hypothetical protein
MRRVNREGRSGTLVVRAWLEGRPPSIRVRITSVMDLTAPYHRVSCAATVGEAAADVRAWLEEFEAGDGSVTSW